MTTTIDSNECLLPARNPWWFPVVGLALFLSWLLPLTALAWDAVDEQVFFFLNGMLGRLRAVDLFWAATNLRYFDAVMGAGFAMLCLFYLLSHRGERFARRFAELLTLALGLLLLRAGLDFAMDLMEYSRRSPSLMLEPVQLLSELVPELDPKDRSRNSFPGDHALVSFWVLAYFVTHAPRKYGIIAAVLATCASIPRLVGGAHWLTDIVIGSVAVILMSFGLLWWSGLFRWTAKAVAARLGWLERRVQALIQRFNPQRD